jgi:hypothetical protein
MPSGQLGARGDPVAILSREVATTSHEVETASHKEAIDIRSVTVARRPMTIVGHSRTIGSHSMSPSSAQATLAHDRENFGDSRRCTSEPSVYESDSSDARFHVTEEHRRAQEAHVARKR